MDDSTRELRVAAALVEAADTLTEHVDEGRQLRRLADRCVELLAARAAGIMLFDEGRVTSLTASGTREELALELLAVQREEGPCLDSYRAGRPVEPVALGSARAVVQWPGFTRRALRHGVTATFAVPLRRGERVLGALNVFLPGATGATAPRLAQSLADGVVLGLHNRTLYHQCRARAQQLERALASRVPIEQAKGMLAERWRTTPDDAFTALRRYARRHQVPLRQVAAAVVDRTADDAALRREAGHADP
ncbi:ANTAR domain-containing protein [Streptomyces flavalbus]|uniref:ANTAR domain-containing protein n=1 Tax=Streptomyces flavalbus TaxID=2665155 RepID=A0ABW2W711_9ACTN